MQRLTRLFAALHAALDASAAVGTALCCYACSSQQRVGVSITGKYIRTTPRDYANGRADMYMQGGSLPEPAFCATCQASQRVPHAAPQPARHDRMSSTAALLTASTARHLLHCITAHTPSAAAMHNSRGPTRAPSLLAHAVQHRGAHDIRRGRLPGEQLVLLHGLADKHLQAAHHFAASLLRLLRSCQARVSLHYMHATHGIARLCASWHSMHGVPSLS